MTTSRKQKVVKDQELFFNLHAHSHSHLSGTTNVNPFFNSYINKEQYVCFDWIADRKTLLDYGCGNGESIDILLEKRNKKDYMIYGVDIANDAIKNVKKEYPTYKFFHISENKIPDIKNNSMDGAYMIHVLHHASGYQDIFTTIHSKLKKKGKFFLNDLTSQNPFINFGRKLFVHMPSFIHKGFTDDLVVEGAIPDKYKINSKKIVSQLKKTGFLIEKVGYGHLFFFLFIWVDKFLPLSKLSFIRKIYQVMIKMENWLLRFHFFQNMAEVIYIQCYKK